jgi:hypothetical protein
MNFAAGALGGVITSVLLWGLGRYGILPIINVRLAPGLSTALLYPNIVWGGIWAQLLLLPLIKSRVLARGLVISIGPTAYHLLYLFPFITGSGFLGLKLGTLTPLVIAATNAVWGIATVLWLRWSDRGL